MVGFCGLPYPQRSGSTWKHSTAHSCLATRVDGIAHRGVTVSACIQITRELDEMQIPGHRLPESDRPVGGAEASAYGTDSLEEKHKCGQLPVQLRVKGETFGFCFPLNGCVSLGNLLNFPGPQCKVVT